MTFEDWIFIRDFAFVVAALASPALIVIVGAVVVEAVRGAIGLVRDRRQRALERYEAEMLYPERKR